MATENDAQQRDNNLPAISIAELQGDFSTLRKSPTRITVVKTLNLLRKIRNGVTEDHIKSWRDILPGALTVEEKSKRFLFNYYDYHKESLDDRGKETVMDRLEERAEDLKLAVGNLDEDARIVTRIHYMIRKVDDLVMSEVMTREFLLSQETEQPTRSDSKELTDEDRQSYIERIHDVYQRHTDAGHPQKIDPEYEVIKESIADDGYNALHVWPIVLKAARKLRRKSKLDQQAQTDPPLSSVISARAEDGAKIGSFGVKLLKAAKESCQESPSAEDTSENSCSQQEDNETGSSDNTCD